MWVPPFVATLPGHHDTCARIMCALPRMNPNEQTNAIRTRKWISLPGTWISRSYARVMSSQSRSTRRERTLRTDDRRGTRRAGRAGVPASGTPDAGHVVHGPHPARLLRHRLPGDGPVPRGALAAHARPALQGARPALVQGHADPVRDRRRDRHDPLVRDGPAVARVHGHVRGGVRPRLRDRGLLVLPRGDLHRDLRLRLGPAAGAGAPGGG